MKRLRFTGAESFQLALTNLATGILMLLTLRGIAKEKRSSKEREREKKNGYFAFPSLPHSLVPHFPSLTVSRRIVPLPPEPGQPMFI